MYLSAKIFVSFLITNALVHPNLAFVPSSNGRATSSKVTFVNNVKSSTVSFASNIDNDQVDIMKKKTKNCVLSFVSASIFLASTLSGPAVDPANAANQYDLSTTPTVAKKQTTSKTATQAQTKPATVTPAAKVDKSPASTKSQEMLLSRKQSLQSLHQLKV